MRNEAHNKGDFDTNDPNHKNYFKNDPVKCTISIKLANITDDEHLYEAYGSCDNCPNNVEINLADVKDNSMQSFSNHIKTQNHKKNVL